MIRLNVGGWETAPPLVAIAVAARVSRREDVEFPQSPRAHAQADI